jgi:hypothetical protein
MEEQIEQVQEPAGLHSLMDIFDELSFREKWDKVFEGLKQPKDTGSYKWARLQMIRLSGPIAAVVLPILIVLIGCIIGSLAPEALKVVEVQVMEPEKIEELKEIKEEIIEPPEPPDPQDIVVTDIISDKPFVGTDPNSTPGPQVDFSPQPAEFDAVSMVKSPVVMRGIYGSRSPGARGAALAGYGGGNATELSVLRALRWLKKNQQQDGSWATTKPAMTGLALLTFMAHGETPTSEEFGYCVEAGLKWMLENQTDEGRFKGSDGNEYSLPIAAYALSEAYSLTQISEIKYAAEKAINIIIKGQHASGGWNYKCNAADDRDDTSYMGWCAQALKAAKMAALDCPGLEAACKKSILGFKKNFGGGYDGGGFGYTSPSATHGLTPVGVLCMQLMGAGQEEQAMGGLATMASEKWMKYDLDAPPAIGKSPLYYWYYATQAKFHAGGDTWNKWNKLFSPELVKKQHVIKKDQSGYVDHKGRPQDIGYWDQYNGSGANENPVFSTVLCALQLEVYYRYLPTFKTPTADVAAAAGVAVKKEGAGKEVNIDIQ